VLPGRSLKITDRQLDPNADGFTHASNVIPVVKSRLFESGTDTKLFDPLKLNAFPNFPAADHTALLNVPVPPCPD